MQAKGKQMNTSLPQQVKIVEVGRVTACKTKKKASPPTLKSNSSIASPPGFANIEAASFVSPKWVPQMATSAEVMAGISRKPGVIYSVLTPNMKGFEAALAAGADEVVIFSSASEAFAQKYQLLDRRIDRTFPRCRAGGQAK
jgi:hydroxymethylglutaryl-CoA lyase